MKFPTVRTSLKTSAGGKTGSEFNNGIDSVADRNDRPEIPPHQQHPRSIPSHPMKEEDEETGNGSPTATTESTWTLVSSTDESVFQRFSDKMTSFYRSKSRTFTWALVLHAISVICLWLCVIAYLLSSDIKQTSCWGWTDTAENSDHLNPNLRPIIGVVAQEYGFYSATGPKRSYIAASYVKFLEGAGARVVPILTNGTEEYVRRIFKSVNGILFPGGAVPFDGSKFADVGRILYRLAVEANDNGDYFPVWGTCLGFEFMLYTSAGNRELRAECGAQNVTNRLKFTDAASSSRLYGNARRSIITALGTQEVTANFHHLCITPENFTKYHLDDQYRILSVNYDSSSKLTYISSVEAKKYPFYAVQFHPEKNIYEWSLNEQIPHSVDALESAQYFANFFVNEARKNHHQFETVEEENNNLIYTFTPDFTGENGSNFEQLYFLPL